MDESYQHELLLKCSDRRWLAKVVHLLRPDVFDLELEPIVARVVNAWNRKKVLSKSQIRQLLQRRGIKLQRVGSGDYTFDAAELTLLCKKSLLRNAMIEALAHLDADDPEAALEHVVRSSRLWPGGDLTAVNILLQPSKNLPRKRLARTEIEKLDKLFGGGTGAGDLAAVVGPTGAGKTAWLVWLAGQAVLAGKRVYYLTLELKENEIRKRLIRSITVSSTFRCKTWTALGRRLNRIGGALYVEEELAGSLSVQDLARRLPANPDLIIVDYADLLRRPGRGGEKEYKELGQLYLNLKNLAQQQDCPLWTASQASRSAYEGTAVRTEHVAGSLEKPQHLDQMLGLSVPGEVDDEGNAHQVVTIAKNRHGPSLLDVSLCVNFASCTYEQMSE